MRRDFTCSEGHLTESTSCDFFTVFENPDETEVSFLTNNLKISEPTLHAALQPESLARVSLDVSHLAVILKIPHVLRESGSFNLRAASMGIFLYESRLVVVTSETLGGWISFLDGVCHTPVTILVHGVSWIVTRFSECLAQINASYDEIEEHFESLAGKEYMRKLFLLEKSLVYYLNAINSNTIALERLRGLVKRFGCTIDELFYLDSVIAENHQCLKQAEVYSNLLAGLVAARLSIVNNNLSALMKTLNLVTIGIMVPTFVVSVFSMNVVIPLHDFRYAFTSILVLALASAVVFAILWKLISTRLS